MRSKAVVFEAADKPLMHCEIAVRELLEGEVLVKVVAATLCGSDLHTLSGRRKVATPTILGHEILGRIVRCSADGDGCRDYYGRPLDTGERVTWAIVANCGSCFYCERGIPQKCERGVKYGHELLAKHGGLTGGLAEYVILAPGTSIFRVPDEVVDAVACPANCATATVAGAFGATRLVREARVRCEKRAESDFEDSIEQQSPLSGCHVLVMGGGMLGVTACAMAKWLGAKSVVGVEPDSGRREILASFGADYSCSPEELSELANQRYAYGFDIALELSGVTSALSSAISHLRIGGEVVAVGAVFPVPEISLLPEQIVRRMLSIQGLHNYAPKDLALALRFLSQQSQELFSQMVPLWMSLADAERAVVQAEKTRAPRVGIRF